MQEDEALFARVYEVVRQVPSGRVASYGDVATVVGPGCDARMVGYALNALPKRDEAAVPWQRIVNREGGISTRGVRQREILEEEGVAFDARGRIPMARFRWAGPDSAWAADHGYHTLQTLSPRDDDDDKGAGEGEQLSLF